MSEMNSIPKVSIVIPVYNGSNYLRQAIDSALAQTYPNVEIVVVNDGSIDGGATERIAFSYGDKLRYFYKENGGVGSALNFAIEKMTGEYFSWLSHDDLYYPNKVATQMLALNGKDRLRTILYSNYAMFLDDNSEVIKEVKLPTTPPKQFRYFITVNNLLHGCTLLVPKIAFDECGVFNEKLRTIQDYDLWFRLAEKYDFVHIPVVLVKGRIHSEQGSQALKETAAAEINRLLCVFVSGLTEQEIIAATQNQPCLAYATIAVNFRQRGFHEAAKCSSALVFKKLTDCTISNSVKALALLLLSVPHSWLRYVYIYLRLRLKKCLSD